MDSIFEISNKLISRTSLVFYRSLYTSINWKAKMIELQGARGVGKTTMLLQKAHELKEKKNKVLYISLDNPFFYNHSIIEVADYFEKYGGQFLFIDEVHKYPQKQKGLDWSAELKFIYDHNIDLKIIYTGSSIIKLYKGKGDLSRRKSVYYLPGLSFREYLIYTKQIIHDAVGLDEIISGHELMAEKIIRKRKILPLFHTYLKNGYYPFYFEDEFNYHQKIAEVISLVIEMDMSSVMDIGYDTVVKVKKLLSAIAASVPYTPNIYKLRQDLSISDHRTILKYLSYLEKADIINMLTKNVKGIAILRKPEKIYLNNTNIAYSLLEHNPDKGNLRETFFCNQVRITNKINSCDAGDFLVEKKYVFEIGGKSKTQKQIKDIKHSFIVKDDIEIGFANQIPLWLFGFMY